MDGTALALFGRARFRVLASLFALGPKERLHLRELARRSGISPTAAQYELRVLTDVDMVVQEGGGRQLTYRVNPNHPAAQDLFAIVKKLDARREPEVIEDDAFWARKRVQQRAAYASPELPHKSPFFTNPDFVKACRPKFVKDTDA